MSNYAASQSTVTVQSVVMDASSSSSHNSSSITMQNFTTPDEAATFASGDFYSGSGAVSLQRNSSLLGSAVAAGSIPLISFGANAKAVVSKADQNLTGNQQMLYLTKSCGFPTFCSNLAYERCALTELNQCSECSTGRAWAFLAGVLVLAFSIMAGNAMVITVVRKNGGKSIFDKIKTSLALADMLVGLQISLIVPRNFSWVLRSTSVEVYEKQLGLLGSLQASFGGIALLFCFGSSLNHLAYLSLQRLYAVSRPISYKMQEDWHIFVGLGVVWGCSLIFATLPVMFPDKLVFTYQHLVFMYLISERSVAVESRSAVNALLGIVYVSPFVIMTTFNVATGITMRRSVARRPGEDHHGNGRKVNNRATNHNREYEAFKTVTVMQAGFILTLVPLITCYSLFYAGILHCGNMSEIYCICFFLTMTNSLVNVLVYSLRDQKFRSGVASLFGCGSGRPEPHVTSRGLHITTTTVQE